MENTKGKIKSYENGKDCFGNSGDTTIDHVWPLSDNGSNTRKNKQSLTSTSNNEKSNQTSGNINGIRFAIEPIEKDENEKIVGKMFIKKTNGWYEIIKVL